MTSVCDLVSQALTAGERAKAKLLLRRTGAAGPVESPEPDVDRVLDLLGRIEKVAAAVRARHQAEGVAEMLTPSHKGCDAEGPTCSDACRDEAPTARIPRAAAAVIVDVIEGSMADLRERVERTR